MKINITKNEYRTLLDILYVADWVLFSHRTEEPEGTSAYRELEQKLLSCAEQFGFQSLVEQDIQQGEFFPSREFEENATIFQYIDEYENDVFWEELIERLGDRDILREMGEEAYHALKPVERWAKEEQYHGRYIEEFSSNGLARLDIHGCPSSPLVQN